MSTWLIMAVAAVVLSSGAAQAQTKDQWIELGTRIHGGFGALIPLGIRIGLDAKERLQAEPRGLSVTYYTGERAPCPCVADGIMLATQASPGQGTLQVMPDKAPDGLFAVSSSATERPARAFDTRSLGISAPA